MGLEYSKEVNNKHIRMLQSFQTNVDFPNALSGQLTNRRERSAAKPSSCHIDGIFQPPVDSMIVERIAKTQMFPWLITTFHRSNKSFEDPELHLMAFASITVSLEIS